MWSDFTWICLECSSPVSSAALAGRPGIVKYAHCQICGGTTRQSAESTDGAVGAQVPITADGGEDRPQRRTGW